MEAQCALLVGVRRRGHQCAGERGGDVAVYTPGGHAGDVRVPGDDLGQCGRVGEDHVVEERDLDRQRWVVQADERGHLRPGAEGAIDPGLRVLHDAGRRHQRKRKFVKRCRGELSLIVVMA